LRGNIEKKSIEWHENALVMAWSRHMKNAQRFPSEGAWKKRRAKKVGRNFLLYSYARSGKKAGLFLCDHAIRDLQTPSISGQFFPFLIHLENSKWLIRVFISLLLLCCDLLDLWKRMRYGERESERGRERER
jgi:hypothetical protein